MKTTIYKLLGMIKDNKAPKKIIYDGYIYQFDNKCENYERDNDIGTSINWDYVAINCLNEPVEILDELKEIKKFSAFEIANGVHQEDILNKINEIIDKLNKED